MKAGEWEDVADPELVPERLAALPSRLFGRISARADRLSTAALAATGAHRWQYAVLVALVDGGPASQATLSRRTGVHRSDLVAVLNELTAAGHVVREPDPDDRRRNVIAITRSGRNRLRSLDALVDRVQDDLLAALTRSERTELVRLLRKLSD